MRTSQSARVHFSTTNTNAGPAVCGENRDPRRRLTLDLAAVTCHRCMMTAAFDSALETLAAMEGSAIWERRRSALVGGQRRSDGGENG